MDNPANPFEQIAAQREDIRRRRAALDEEERVIEQSVMALCKSLGLVTIPVRAAADRGEDGTKRTFLQRVLSVVRSSGREGVAVRDVAAATKLARTAVSPILSRLKNDNLVARREGTNLWVAVTPPDGGYATPANGPVS